MVQDGKTKTSLQEFLKYSSEATAILWSNKPCGKSESLVYKMKPMHSHQSGYTLRIADTQKAKMPIAYSEITDYQ